MRILVVDNGESMTMPVAVVLRQAGNHVEIIHDGEKALSAVTANPDHYNLVITDHRMRFTGLQIVSGLRGIGFPGEILVLSASLQCNVEEEYRKLGVETFITKPFDLSELRQAVGELAVSKK